MYPLAERTSGPTVRISHLRDELADMVDLDVVAGWRGARRVALARYAVSGRLRGLDGIYVESSSFLPAEADIAFLGLARSLGVRVLTYVRDAYQLFAEYAEGGSPRRRAGRAAFRPALRLLRAVSSAMAFPTSGLARAVLGPARAADAVLLPPGAPPPARVAAREGADRLLYVGAANLPSHGVDRLLAAVAMAREAGTQVELTVVAREGQDPPPPHPAWLRIERADQAAIPALLPDVSATVIPRPRSRYNDLALPIKLWDYLSYGRPLLVTDCVEQARVVADAEAGLVSGDSPAELAAAVGRLLAAAPAQRERWSSNAERAAVAASWRHRARRIVEVLVGS